MFQDKEFEIDKNTDAYKFLKSVKHFFFGRPILAIWKLLRWDVYALSN
jgi:hypothetical protein